MRPGDALSTGPTASPSDPYQATVQTPSGGAVSIVERPSGPAPAGFTLLGWGFDISAPAETADRPLRLTFRIDAEVLPAQPSVAGLAVFRNGVEGCSGPQSPIGPPPTTRGSG